MYNLVVLVGRVCTDIDLRYSPKGKAYVRFTLAVDRPYRNADKEYETDFIRCIVWGKQAELFAQYQGKGNLIQLQGKLQIDKYEKNGKTKYNAMVVCDTINFLEKNRAKG